MCLAGTLGAASPAALAAAAGERVVRRELTMGTWLELEVRATDRTTALAASEAALAAVAAADARLSTWRDDSELARFNRTAAGRWVELSPTLAADLATALDWSERTGRAFDPTVGALVDVWELRGAGRMPSAAELRRARPPAGALELDGRRARRTTPEIRLEEGGFGKGAGLRDAAAAALARGASCVVLDFGGQVVIAGACGDVAVGVADPVRRETAVAWLAVGGGSLATSGGSERSVSVDGQRLSHILDPRSGRPVRDWGTVTVVAADPVVADCVATALVVMGPEQGAAWVAREPAVEALFAVRRGAHYELAASKGLAGRLRSVTSGRVLSVRPTNDDRPPRSGAD